MENDMDHIQNQIWLGNKESAFNYDKLMYHNIHYVINCTPNLPNMFENKGVKYYRVPIHDKEVCDLSYSKQMYEYILGSFNFIDEALKNNSGVLVHCKKGHHRSANIILFYLIYKYNMGYINALMMINQIRPTALVRNTCINNWGLNIYKQLVILKYIKQKGLDPRKFIK